MSRQRRAAKGIAETRRLFRCMWHPGGDADLRIEGAHA
jgi:hypothetical protein